MDTFLDTDTKMIQLRHSSEIWDDQMFNRSHYLAQQWFVFTRRQRDWYFSAELPGPAPHLAHPEGCPALRIVRVTVPCVSRSREHFSDGFDLHLLQSGIAVMKHMSRSFLDMQGASTLKK